MTDTPERELAVRAIDVVVSLSEANLATGTTPNVYVPRSHVLALAAAVERLYPGVIAETRRLLAEEGR